MSDLRFGALGNGTTGVGERTTGADGLPSGGERDEVGGSGVRQAIGGQSGEGLGGTKCEGVAGGGGRES